MEKIEEVKHCYDILRGAVLALSIATANTAVLLRQLDVLYEAAVLGAEADHTSSVTKTTGAASNAEDGEP